MRRAVLALVVLALGCAGSPTEPSIGQADPPAPAFPQVDAKRALAPMAANLSPSTCVIAWPIETDHRATWVFRTTDGGSSFSTVGELISTVEELHAADGRLFAVSNQAGGGVVPYVLRSDDQGTTWEGHGGLEAALEGTEHDHSAIAETGRFASRTRGAVRVQGEGWYITEDGGDTWTRAPGDDPGFEPADRMDGPCRVRDAHLQRRTPGGWEDVPGTPDAG